MKRTLIWGRMLPFEDNSAGRILSNNLIASNSGNMLFTEAVLKSTMTSKQLPDCFYAEDVDRLIRDPYCLNDRYECALIPLANAFRPDFRPKLRKLTEFLKVARFPCHIIGVGLQAGKEEEIKQRFVFDDDVRAFVKAALDRTNVIGLRGEYTAAYLQRLGFLPEQHFSVIGCPSAYMNGRKCEELRAPSFESLKSFAVNAVPTLPAQAGAFLRNAMEEMAEYDFVYQNIYELWSLYFPYKRKIAAPSYYPTTSVQKFGGGIIGFLHASEWIEYMKGRDLCLGSRIHGNMAAVLAGTPAILLPTDLRVRELARIHKLPYVEASALREGQSLREIYEQADFQAFSRSYAHNFENYLFFLRRNGIANIYDSGLETDAPYNRLLARTRPLGAIRADTALPIGEIRHIPRMYWMLLRYKLDRMLR